MSVTDPHVHALPLENGSRRELHNAVHARPVDPIPVPSLVTHLAVLHEHESADREREEVLTVMAGAEPVLDPFDPGFVRLRTSEDTIQWQRHGEFSLYSVAQPLDESRPPTAQEVSLAAVSGPADWLRRAPGQTIAALQIVVLPAPADPRADDALLRGLLGPGRMLGSRLRDADARVFTTYRLDDAGVLRAVLLVGDGVSPLRVGRIVWSLAQIEIYRVLAMRAFPQARRLQTHLADVERRLAVLTQLIDRESADDQALLHELLSLAASVQTANATSAAAFSAARAYHGIVRARLEEQRGSSVPGRMGVFTYLDRRLTPAMATVEATSLRLEQVSRHTAQAADLLRTRVGINSEQQNTELLGALESGQRTQLRLQETVEGLSIAAISYYAVGLIGYLIKGVKGAGVHLDSDMATAISVPFVVVAVWYLLRRAKRGLNIGSH